MTMLLVTVLKCLLRFSFSLRANHSRLVVKRVVRFQNTLIGRSEAVYISAGHLISSASCGRSL